MVWNLLKERTNHAYLCEMSRKQNDDNEGVTEAVKIHMSTMCKECAHRSRMPDIYNGKLGDGSFGKEMNDRWSPICSDHRALLRTG